MGPISTEGKSHQRKCSRRTGRICGTVRIALTAALAWNSTWEEACSCRANASPARRLGPCFLDRGGSPAGMFHATHIWETLCRHRVLHPGSPEPLTAHGGEAGVPRASACLGSLWGQLGGPRSRPGVTKHGPGTAFREMSAVVTQVESTSLLGGSRSRTTSY